MVSKQQPNGKQMTTKIREKGSRLRFYSADTVKHTAVNGGKRSEIPTFARRSPQKKFDHRRNKI